jgi:TolA-binding protein
MDENRKKTSVWLYAVILFFSAFIVLVFTGYSQIKLNKNLENYKSQVTSTESEKEMYQKHFASAQEMNEDLNQEIDSLKIEIDSLRQEISALKATNTDLEYEYSQREAEGEKLSEAMKFYLDGQPAECVDMLRSIDTELISEKSLKMLDILRSKAGAQAGSLFYDKGYNLYLKGKYDEAAAAFELSYKYEPKGEISDKCLYYLSYAKLKAGDRKTAVEKMKLLVENFPESKYISKAKSFVRRYQQ